METFKPEDATASQEKWTRELSLEAGEAGTLVQALEVAMQSGNCNNEEVNKLYKKVVGRDSEFAEKQ